jgi:hypothetical protein
MIPTCSNKVKAKTQATKQLARPEKSCTTFLVLMSNLPLDILAHMLLFGELQDVFHSVGVSCPQLYAAIWRQPDFWLALGGPVFVKVLQENGNAAPSLQPAIGTVFGTFRRWIFGIEGSWSQNLMELANQGDPSEAIREVLSLSQGLCAGDATDHDVWCLTKAAVDAMRRLKSFDKESCMLAGRFVQCCQKRQSVFNNAQLAELTSAVGSLQERVIQQDLDSSTSLVDKEAGLSFDPWDISDEIMGFKDLDAPPLQFGGQQGKCLALSFLAVLEQQEQH